VFAARTIGINAISRAGAASIAMVSMLQSAFADACIRHEEMTALQVAAVQQQLMVAALSCNAVSLYNRFVVSYQRDLRTSDEALKAFFLRMNPKDGLADYHAFKTRLANRSSLRSAGDSESFCEDAYAAFDAALASDPRSLDDFVAGQPVPEDLGYSDCATAPRMLARNETRMVRRHHRRDFPPDDEDDGVIAPKHHPLASDAPAP
jgi:hypothetical protein